MKKRILYSLVSSGVLLLAACNETWNPGVSGEGSIVPVVTLDTNTQSSRSDKQAARSNADEITVDDLHLKLTSTANGTVREWESINDFKLDEKFNVGTYNFEAYYGDKSNEGFESPYYYGVTTVSVRENETSQATLTASLGNAMLSLKYTEAFTNYFTDYSVDIKTLAGSTIAYSRQENRPAYVAPGSVQLVVNVVKPNGQAATYQAMSFSAAARHHYNVTLNVNDGNVGNAELVISFDDTLDIEDVVIDLSEDLENIPEPTIKAEGFTPGSAIDVVAGSDAENQLSFTVSARGGIASAMLETKSTALVESGWPATVDLVATPAATQTTMSALGFKEIGMWRNPDKMAVVDLTSVIPFIKYIEGATNETTFTLTVTDRLSQQSEALTLAVNIDRLTVDIVSAETLMFYESEATFELAYNGADAANRIGVQYMNVAGAWTNLKVESIGAKSRALAAYTVKVSGLPDDAVQGEKDVTLRAVAKNAKGEVVQISEEYTLARMKVPFGLSVEDNNVFALRATGTLQHDSESVADFAQRAKLEMSTDNGTTYSEYNFEVDGDKIKIEGLKSSTTYLARIKADGMNCKPVTFTTEAELRLPNAGMEEWHNEDINSYCKYYIPFAQDATDAVWNTYNPVTLSQPGAKYGYTATSGTVRTGDSHSGSYAAQVRTVGWGSGSTASANAFNSWAFGTPKHISAGQLFLGNWDGVTAQQDATPNYGMEFASRPSSMTFWYKYAPMNRKGNDNGQKGVAIVRVLDVDGNTVSEETLLLDKNASYANVDNRPDYSVNGEYVEKTISLNYGFNASKAAKLMVIFKSTNYTTSELEAQKNENHMRPPKPMNLGAHEYLGSSLLVDDITLNY